MNPQIFLLFVTTVLGHYTSGEKSHNISILSYFSYSQVSKGEKLNKLWKESYFTSSLFPLANISKILTEL